MGAEAKYQTVEESREALVLYIQKHGRIPTWWQIPRNREVWQQRLFDLATLGYLAHGETFVRGDSGTWSDARRVFWKVNAVKPDRNLGTYRTHGVGGGRDAEIIAEIELERNGANIECPECEGQGKIWAGEQPVTRAMALDAGDPSMEGMREVLYDACPVCLGDCVVGAED